MYMTNNLLGDSFAMLNFFGFRIKACFQNMESHGLFDIANMRWVVSVVHDNDICVANLRARPLEISTTQNKCNIRESVTDLVLIARTAQVNKHIHTYTNTQTLKHEHK